MLDELYSDFIKIDKSLKKLLENKIFHLFKHPKINRFIFNPEANKKFELYVLSLRKKTPKTVSATQSYAPIKAPISSGHLHSEPSMSVNNSVL